MPGGPPLFPVCPPSARVHPPPAAARTPFPLSTPAHARFPLVMAPFPRPLHAPSARARSPRRPAPSARARSPLRFLRFPRPAPPSSTLPSPALGRFPIPCTRPLRPSPPAPPLLSRPFLQFRAPPLQKNAVRAAGLTRRGCGPGFRACAARFCGLPRARGAGGGATVAAGHKTGLPRGRGAGIRRNGRRNRQAGLPRAVGGGGAAPASVPASLDFATCRAREGTRVAAQRSLPGIKPACRAGGARVSGGMIGKIVRPACRARWAAGGGRCPVQPFFCKKEEARHRGFARAALHESGRGCEYYRRGE